MQKKIKLASTNYEVDLKDLFLFIKSKFAYLAIVFLAPVLFGFIYLNIASEEFQSKVTIEINKNITFKLDSMESLDSISIDLFKENFFHEKNLDKFLNQIGIKLQDRFYFDDSLFFYFIDNDLIINSGKRDTIDKFLSYSNSIANITNKKIVSFLENYKEEILKTYSSNHIPLLSIDYAKYIAKLEITLNQIRENNLFTIKRPTKPKRISPKKKQIFFISFLIGFILSLLFIFFSYTSKKIDG